MTRRVGNAFLHEELSRFKLPPFFYIVELKSLKVKKQKNNYKTSEA